MEGSSFDSLPAAWETSKRKQFEFKNARRCKRPRHDFQNRSHVDTIKLVVEKQLAIASETPTDITLDIDPLLSSIPFIKLLNTIKPDANVPSIPLVSRQYEERFLREALPHKESSCVMGSQCECMVLDIQKPFVGMQFVIPNTLETNDNDAMPTDNTDRLHHSNSTMLLDDISDLPESTQSTSNPNPNGQQKPMSSHPPDASASWLNRSKSTNGMCLLCLRKTTQILFYQTIHKAQRINGVIQKYGNICNEAGEYHNNAMLVCPPNGPIQCIPLPIVSHQRSN